MAMSQKGKVIPLAVKYVPGSPEELRYWQAYVRALWTAERRTQARARRRRRWYRWMAWTGCFWGLQWLGAGLALGIWNPAHLLTLWGWRFAVGVVGVWAVALLAMGW